LGQPKLVGDTVAPMNILQRRLRLQGQVLQLLLLAALMACVLAQPLHSWPVVLLEPAHGQSLESLAWGPTHVVLLEPAHGQSLESPLSSPTPAEMILMMAHDLQLSHCLQLQMALPWVLRERDPCCLLSVLAKAHRCRLMGLSMQQQCARAMSAKVARGLEVQLWAVQLVLAVQL